MPMSSGGGTSNPRPIRRAFFSLPKERYSVEEDGDGIIDENELVPPPSLAAIVPFLRAADEIQEDNPRVAYLCRLVAYEKARAIDPAASVRGVGRFQARLVQRLEKEKVETQRRLASTDSKEAQRFYERYCNKQIEEGVQMRKPDEIATYYQTASVLFDVLKYVTPEKFLPQFDKYGKTLEEEKASLRYNILPLSISGPRQPVMDIPEIKAAADLLRRVEYLPHPRPDPASVSEEIDGPIICDLLDWLWQTFGFQKSNVENQKEHLILLLANIEMSEGSNFHQGEKYDCTIHTNVVQHLMKKIFQNYICWCRYLHLESNIKIPVVDAATQQPELLYIGLYLLIWGEASNVRFMPECLCYIFHHMAKDLYDNVLNGREGYFDPPIQNKGGDDAFLNLVIQPMYNILHEEAVHSKHGTVSHSKWRNYDDLNEYFWSKNCFQQFGWPPELRTIDETKRYTDHLTRRIMSKTNFVEVRTFLHLFRSFDRMWAFLTLTFQAMVIIAWNPSGSLYAIVEPGVFRNVLTIFITAAFLNFLQATFDIVLNWKAWRSLACSQKIRYILKFFVAIGWLIILPTTYLISIQNHTRLVKFFGNHIGDFQSGSVYNFTASLYMLPNIFSALLFIFLPIKRLLESSNSRIARFIVWWAQPKLYVSGRMYTDTCSYLKYALFWIILLICKLAFSFYVEICPLVGPTKKILFSERKNHARHELFPYLGQIFGFIITLWAPVVMVYFIDTQIWYAIFSALYGGLNGAFSRLGEIGTLGTLRLRFEAIPTCFSKHLVPRYGCEPKGRHFQDYGLHIGEFSDIWNAIISSLRHEDLISNRERNLLIVPSSTGDTTYFPWPPFLLACQIPIALDMASSVRRRDEELTNMIKQDAYTYYAVVECYETMLNLLYSLISVPSDKIIVDRIRERIEMSIRSHLVVKEFRLDELPQLNANFEKLLTVLLRGYVDIDTIKTQITNLLQDIMEIILNDIMKDGKSIVMGENLYELFANPNLDSINDEAFRQKCVRLQLLLTMKESTIYVPTNSEARRRIIFFANSLFMKMPRAPDVHKMMSFSILTPYFKENVLFSAEDLCKEKDGISLLFYLRKMFPDEWHNFLERINFNPKNEDSLKLKMDDICPWASYRGQTLTRTVRGMMYYRRALEIQCIQDKTNLEKYGRTPSSEVRWPMVDMAQAIADIKFTYVVSCQVYGMQKLSKDPRDRACYLNILNLMITYPSLRVAYIDEVEALTKNGTIERTYYSVLVKGVGDKYDEEIYRIKLPGKPTNFGEGRPENQNHAIIFTRGEALQAIDMNQDNYLQEAFKMRNILEEFRSDNYGKDKPTILGLRENIFTGSVSSLAWFFSNQETGFVTIGQRVLANPLRVRFHYGHTDIFDRLFHITRGGISKASKTINLSGEIFSGFNSTMRGGCVTHHEYMEVGKGRDVIMNNISYFEARAANGNAEQTLSRDVYRLGHGFDFYRMLSFYFSTVGIYFSSMVTVLTVYVFLYGRLYIVVSGSERSMLLDPRIQESSKPLDNALASQAVFQLGLMLVLPMLMEIAVEQGLRSALIEFVMMQLQLASVFFTFQLGTRSHYYGRTILHGGFTYKRVGRGSVVHHAKFAENYRMYSRSHFVKGFELLILLVLYQAYESSYQSSKLHKFVTFSIWFLVASWLFAPFIFNPLCFDRQKVVDDWMDWREWMGEKGGFGMSVEQGWQAWWISEQEHLRKTSIRAIVLEIILSLRFLIYQYAIVYYLNIEHSRRSIPVYALSLLLMFVVLFVLKMISIGQRKCGMDLPLLFRIINGLIFLGLVSLVIILFVVLKLTISGLLASILGFILAGWGILLIGQACRPLVKMSRMWDSIVQLGRAYDDMMGFILYMPIGFLSLFSLVSELQTLLLFNKASTRGIQISRILAGQ